jgi:hypothetical protein
VALLAGLTYNILHTSRYMVVGARVLPGTSDTMPTRLSLGVYCAYAAVVLFAGALLLAGGAWHRRPGNLSDETDVDDPDPGLQSPADLTVTPIPANDHAVWSDREGQ